MIFLANTYCQSVFGLAEHVGSRYAYSIALRRAGWLAKYRVSNPAWSDIA